ncbi:MAG TPA: hypothetical protein VGT82_13595, partial [Ktedonobacteraceae bacterium]|nr:hypothetical protein [Ktedonobacteraceae bacterium]
MYRIQYRILPVTFLTILALLLAGCSQTTSRNVSPTSHLSLHGNATIHSIEIDLLTNMQANGFDSDADGPGGLWVNWRYGTQPLQTNINGTGAPDGPGINPPRHDELTDLRYIHNLWSYKRQNPTDTSFDGEIARYTPIIKREFAHSHNERGWLYDEASALYQLTNDSFYRDMAFSLASSYARAYNANIGSIFQTSADHPYGSYRVDMVLEEGCALIQAGTFFQRRDWQQMGMYIVTFVYAHAYIPQYHTFADQMDAVLLPDGTVNPNEQFYMGQTRNYTVDGSSTHMGEISQIAISLLDTYSVTHEQSFL